MHGVNRHPAHTDHQICFVKKNLRSKVNSRGDQRDRLGRKQIPFKHIYQSKWSAELLKLYFYSGIDPSTSLLKEDYKPQKITSQNKRSNRPTSDCLQTFRRSFTFGLTMLLSSAKDCKIQFKGCRFQVGAASINPLGEYVIM